MRPATRATTLRSLGIEVLIGSRLRRVTRRIIGAWPLGRSTRPRPRRQGDAGRARAGQALRYL